MKIALFVEGGVLTGVVADEPGAEVILIDFDTDGESGQLYDPGEGFPNEDCHACQCDVGIDPDTVRRAEAALTSFIADEEEVC